MLNVGTISEFNAVIIWFNLLMTWVIRGRDRLISKVAEWAEELWVLLAPDLQLIDSFFWSSVISDPSRLVAGCSLQSELWILEMLNVWKMRGRPLFIDSISLGFGFGLWAWANILVIIFILKIITISRIINDTWRLLIGRILTTLKFEWAGPLDTWQLVTGRIIIIFFPWHHLIDYQNFTSYDDMFYPEANGGLQASLLHCFPLS